MKTTKTVLAAATFATLTLLSCQQKTYQLPLQGQWQFALDPTNRGLTDGWQSKPLSETITLPGSLQAQGKGDDISVNTQWTGGINDRSWFCSPDYAAYRTADNIKIPFWLNPDKHYVGAAWYSRQIDIPRGWQDRTVELNLERTHWHVTVFVDGREIGEGTSLLTPNRFIIDGLTPGSHTITLRIDNSLLVDVGENAHSVSDHTQSNWNGVIGNMSLLAKPTRYLGAVTITPDIEAKTAHVSARINGHGKSATMTLAARDSKGRLQGKATKIRIGATDSVVETTVDLGADAQLWSEFTPNVYKMCATLTCSDGTDRATYDFGLREFRRNGTRFEINGHPVFLRGTLECCIFPLTGYPAMTSAYWAKIFQTCRNHGLNHVRFHSWCPPEVAFHVADSLGMYLQIECGGWATIGDGQPQDQWFRDESERILREYGNHPSFCMLVYGNEPDGRNQAQYLTDLVAHWKDIDNRRVFSGAAGWPDISNGDYRNTPDPRIQAWGQGLRSIINSQPPRSDYDWRASISKDKPTVSHEIGQWCVYPNFKEIEKYTGVLKARNFEIFRNKLEEKGMGDMAEKFLYASGRLQTLCYKADIEAALRTPGFAGFQLLDLHDFPGQGTALVGVLDPFWESKGYVSAEEFSTFCNQTVPLVRFPKLVINNNDPLSAPIEVAHFGQAPLKSARITWRITDTADKLLASGDTIADLPIGNCISAGHISADFSSINTPTALTVSVSIEGTPYHNNWHLWVYPARKSAVSNPPYITDRLDSVALRRLNRGEAVLFDAYGKVAENRGGNIKVGFSSIFWNTAWTRGQAPHTLGVCCDPAHPALADFPNEGVSDYQWWDLMSRCNATILDDMPHELTPIVSIIDDWFTNRKLAMVYEVKVGNGKLLVCGADISHDLDSRPAAAQLRQSLLQYMASPKFNPTVNITPRQLDNIFLK